MTTRLTSEMPSPLVCVDIPEAHKFHSGKGTECSFPTGKVNENWNHPKANSGQCSARDHSLLFCFQSNDIFLMKTPVPCAVARLWLFCDVNFRFNDYSLDVYIPGVARRINCRK